MLEFRIYDWMVEDLDLHSNVLLIYAYIYAWTYHGKLTRFSYNEIAKKVNCSKVTAVSSIEILKNFGYIEKESRTIDEVTYNYYRVNPEYVPEEYKEVKDGTQL